MTNILNAAIIARLANEALAASPYPNPIFPPSPYYRFLRLLAKEMKSILSVELGVCGGGGSLHLAIGASPNPVIGVDFAWDHPSNIRYILSNYKNFSFMRGDSVIIAKGIYETFGEIDILFIDTTHTFAQTMKEYNAYEPYLSDRAAICLDDLFRPGMIDAWNQMPEPKMRLDNLHIGGSPLDGGFGVVWK